MKRSTIPHPIPYQGSKRRLAFSIASYLPNNIKVLYEPFAGSAAFTLFAAKHELAQRFVVGDVLEPLIDLWKLIVDSPAIVSEQYDQLWRGQHNDQPDYYYKVRSSYNQDHDPIKLLYLITRCVKNAVRFGKDGRFTQSVDKRRLGMHPNKMRKAVFESSILLRGKTEFFVGDFEDCIQAAGCNDFVYMDPPYQGTTDGNDKRYFKQLEPFRLRTALTSLNDRNIPFVLSYDGQHGDKIYGEVLPDYLKTHRVLLEAGRSAQATLQGKNVITFEALYISQQLMHTPKLWNPATSDQLSLGLEII